MSESKKLTLALVGCGGIAQAHWRGIQEHEPRIQVTAVVDTDPTCAAKMAQQTGGKPFTSLKVALEQDGLFDAVDIMLPHYLHEEAAQLAFEAGKHVLLEKPMAPTLDACDRILAAARQAGTVFMIAEQAQYWPDACMVRDLIQAGAIGEIITARAYFGNPVRTLQGPKPWRYELAKAGGGITIDGGAHWIRPLRMWLGEIDEVVGVVGRPLAEAEGETLARALLVFESGKPAVFDALHAGVAHGPAEDFRVTGTEGELIVEKIMKNGGGDRLLLFDGNHREGKVLMKNKTVGRVASFGYELNDFTQAVLDGKPLVAGPEYSLGELRTALAIYRSAQSRQWEKVWD